MTVPRRRVRRATGERGLALIFGSLMMVVLLLFSSFAIDFGALYNHRRADQNAADSGALAAAQDLPASVATMVATAKQYVHNTLGVSFTPEQWNSCAADDGSLPNLALGANCISYGTDQVRVRVPDQRYDTMFARVIGIDDFRHSAFAVAGLVPEGFGGVLPFGVTGTSAQGGFGCLQSNSNGQASDVCGSVSGNFRFLNFSQFGSATFSTVQSCSNPSDQRLVQNMAMGVDHSLSRYGTVYAGEIVDHEACSANPQTPTPNAVESRTGNQSDDATLGLFAGASALFPDGQPARLRRHHLNLFDGGAPAPIDVFGVRDLDNVPLWDFIPSSYGPGEAVPANIPASCRRSEFVDTNGDFSIANVPAEVQSFLAGRTEGDQSVALIQRCIDHYRGNAWSGFPIGTMTVPEPPSGCTGPCSHPIFARNSTTADEPDLFDIQYTARFGYVPELDGFGPGNSVSRMLSFRPVFIQRLFIERAGGGYTWDPGVFPRPPTGGSYQRLGETSIFVFPTGSLPNNLDDPDAAFQVGANRFVRLIR